MPQSDGRCSRCGAADPVPILYGMPTGKAAEAAARGELVLGGCAVGPNDPNRQCWACGHRWLSGVWEKFKHP